MAKITFTSILTGFRTALGLNTNFQAIATELNDKVLYRDNPTGETNSMVTDLDMNSKRILNLPAPLSGLEPARFDDVRNGVNTIDAVIPSFTQTVTKYLSSDGIGLVFRGISKPNIAAMTAILKVDLANGDALILDGYTSKGDGGGGRFFWDASSIETDNGGTIFITDEGGTGRWKRIFSDIVNVKWFGAVGDFVADDTSAFQEAVNIAKLIICPDGRYKVTNISISNDDVTIVGLDWATTLEVGANNSNIFNVSGDNFTLKEIKLRGDGTSSASNNGNGLSLTDTNDLTVNKVWFDNFGFAAIQGVATILSDIKIIDIKTTNTAAEGIEIFLGGLWKNIYLIRPNLVTVLAKHAMLLFDNGTTGWRNFTADGGFVKGYKTLGLASTDEAPDAVFRGGFKVNNVDFEDIESSAIKCKNSPEVIVNGGTFLRCSTRPEGFVSGLHGDILINASPFSIVTNTIHRDSGTDAIRVIGRTAANGGTPSGTIRINHIISNISIENPGSAVGQLDALGATISHGDGINLGAEGESFMLSKIACTGAQRYCIGIDPNSTQPMGTISVKDSQFINNPDVLTPIFFQNGSKLILDGNQYRNSGKSTGPQTLDVDEIIVGSTDAYVDPPVGATPARGYQFINAKSVKFHGRSGNTAFDSWAASTVYAVGDKRKNGTQAYQCKVAGTSAGSGGPTVTSGDEVDNTVTWSFYSPADTLLVPMNLTGTVDAQIVGADFSGLTNPVITGLPDNALIRDCQNLNKPFVTFSGDATPDVKNIEYFFVSGSTTITNFDNGNIGNVIVLTATSSFTVSHNSNINLQSGSNFNMVSGNTLTLQRSGTTLWRELARKT